jgi:peptidoglycan-associated lipoprotein
MNKLLTVGLLSLLLMAGCASQEEGIDNQTEQAQDTMQDQGRDDGAATPIAGSDTEATALQQDQLSAQELLEQQDSPLASRIIYFDYDSAKVDEDSLALLEAHGDFLASNGNVHVTLVGHTDERGSREYNIALGDRRAQSVRRILLFQGASSDQIDTISYGEEQPAVLGHDEAAWSKNRRVELQYEVQ